MTIRHKISLILTTVVLLSGILAAYIASNSSHTQNDIQVIAEYQLEEVEGVTEAINAIQKIRSNIRAVILEHLEVMIEQEKAAVADKKINHSWNIIKQSLEDLSNSFSKLEQATQAGFENGLDWDDEVKRLAIIKKDVFLFSSGVKEFLAINTGHTEGHKARVVALRNIFEEKIEPVSRIIQSEMKNTVADEKREIEEMFEEVVGLANTSTNASIALFTIIIFTGLVIFYSIHRIVTKPIESLQNAAIKLGEGNFNVTLDVQSEDEIGQLAIAFKQMAADLRTERESLEKARKYTKQPPSKDGGFE
jgi:HAMP domain-containing protein